MSKRQYGSNWIKWLIQIISLTVAVLFIFTDLPDKFIPGYHNIVDAVKGLDLSDTVTLVVISLLLVFFGRLFCGFLCPAGAAQDLLMALRNDFGIRQLKVNGKADYLLRFVKYVFLFALTIILYKGIKFSVTGWILIVVASVAALLSLIMDRFFCKYLCPAGACLNTFKFWLPMCLIGGAYYGLELLFKTTFPAEAALGLFCLSGYLLELLLHKNVLHLLRVVKCDDRCTHCGECTRRCPYSIDIQRCGNLSNDMECTLCGTCVAACRHKALGIGIISKRNRERGFGRFIPGIVVIAVVAALVIWALI